MFTNSKKKFHCGFCKSRRGFWTVIIIAIVVALSVSQKSDAKTFQDMAVDVKGEGPAILFIPGLNSASETFTETCEAFVKTYSCHLLHLPGFAGLPPTPATQQQFLVTMRDTIRAYIDNAQLKHPILIGHSLGGVLSLMLAIDDPELARALIIVDALPFYPAIHNPALTSDLVLAQAEQMRAMMRALPPEQYHQNAAMNLTGMSNNSERLPLLTEWSNTSDPLTTTQAMYDMMTTDLRPDLHKITTPTLVLGAWAAYKNYGSTQESTRMIYASQYAQLKNVDIRMATDAFHFITWDEPQWANQEIAQFLNQ
jgi:pimeloyl-ACP methyl ester carboxylesterase